MKYLVILSLVAFCAYQLSSIEAAANIRPKRWLSQGECPENTTTLQECIDYFYPDGKKGCSEIRGGEGKTIQIIGCGVVLCNFEGKDIEPTEDPTKPFPHCCPQCGDKLSELIKQKKSESNQ